MASDKKQIRRNRAPLADCTNTPSLSLSRPRRACGAYAYPSINAQFTFKRPADPENRPNDVEDAVTPVRHLREISSSEHNFSTPQEVLPAVDSSRLPEDNEDVGFSDFRVYSKRRQTKGRALETLSLSCPPLRRPSSKRKRMKYEGGNVLEVDRASHQLFLTFMARYTQFEEMGKLGSQLLAGFHQELELFRRPQLSESSQVLANIIEHNQSERLRTYTEAGCRHILVDQQVTVKLNSYFEGLKKHVEQAQELLKDLEHLVENATVMMQEATNTMLKNIKKYTEEDSTEGSSGTESDKGSISDDHKLEISDFVAMMSVIFNMLRQDYAMQEKVVADLQLNTPSETLQSYSLMWTLHPFIDERIINKALTWV